VPGFGDATDIVATQIDEHQVFGAFLRIGEQLGFQRDVFFVRAAARAACRRSGAR
jgi:hypothetical protein